MKETKKINVLFFIFVFVSSISFSQSIKVVDSLSVEEIVKDVLVQSACANIENMKSSTGTNYDSPNGIAVFYEPTGNFPYKSGVLLSTGSAKMAEGPKQTGSQSEGTNNWLGDSDLEDVLKISDTTETRNASYIEFDFTTPLNQVSFNFIFASEEYGKYQCQYTDGFAFLLTDIETGVTTNLALVPGTQDPISVLNIRDKKYIPEDNTSQCESVNEKYFDRYFEEDNPNAEPLANSPTNFRGYTKSIKAFSKVIPDKKYHIKLVIADFEDNAFDAGIFLEAGSFDLGGGLGDDITIQSGKATCDGGDVQLKSGLDANVPHIWYYEGTVIPNETKSEIYVSKPGEYKVEVILTQDCIAEDTILVEFINPSEVKETKLLVGCDDGTGLGEFDLTQNSALALGDQDATKFQVRFFETKEAAEAGTPEIANPSQFQAANDTEVYVRVEDVYTRKCYDFKPFMLYVRDISKSLEFPEPLLGCDDDNDSRFVFDLNERVADIFKNVSVEDYTYAFFETQDDADRGTGEISALYANDPNKYPLPQTIYVRVTGEDLGCVTTKINFVIDIENKPNTNSDKEPLLLEECDDEVEIDGNTANDSVVFDLTKMEPEIFDDLDPKDYVIDYFISPDDAEGGINALPDYKNFRNTANPQEVYARIVAADNLESKCISVEVITLKVNPLPVIKIDNSYVICLNDDQDVYATSNIDTGLSESDYDFEWTLEGTTEVLGEESKFKPSFPGVHIVKVIDKKTGCESTAKTQVYLSSTPKVTAEVITPAFAENHMVQVFVVAEGDVISRFEFSLDNGPWEGNISRVGSYKFRGLEPGEHTIRVRDVHGCGETTVTFYVMGHLPFFTPNNDSYHDKWQIYGMKSHPEAKIYVFDRYGKLVSQVDPRGDGWDGNYRGNPMPTADYWFTVEYVDKKTNALKQFKGHFALKR